MEDDGFDGSKLMLPAKLCPDLSGEQVSWPDFSCLLSLEHQNLALKERAGLQANYSQSWED